MSPRSATAAGPATPGRPRRAEIESAINAAARDLLAEVGYGALTIEAVAKRAGVGKPTVYRRHESKAALVAAALLDVLETVNPAAPDTGDVAADLVALLGNLARALTTEFGAAVTEIVSPAAREPQLAELFAAVIDDRRVLIRQVVQRAADQHRLLVPDVETAIDLALGAIYFRHLFTHDRIDEGFVGTVVASLVVSTVESSPSEGRRPS